MADSTDGFQEPALDLSMGTSQLPGRDILDRSDLRELNARSDGRGLLRLAAHLLTLCLTGLLVHMARGHMGLLVPSMMLHGFAIVTLFAPMHECVHMTPFRSRWLNKTVGWIVGVPAFYNSDYYRRFHHWHHRFTQDPEHDPELMTPKPNTLGAYWLRLSGIVFWRDRLQDLLMVSLGRTHHLPYVPAQAHRVLAGSVRLQVALYLVIAGVAIFYQSTAPLVYWLLPILLGQPLIRAILIAEHTGCSEGPDGLSNTRTTLTSWPVRLLMWNMPFHAEHHLYPSIPFHALPRAHARIRARLTHLDEGYIKVNRDIRRSLSIPAG
jgi:fatty acid desaturase